MKKQIAKITLLIIAWFVMAAFNPGSVNTKMPIYLNTSYSFKERAADLVSRMTPEEKQSQLGNTMPPIPRLGVNYYDVWGEALHGVMGRNLNSGMTATSFPNSVALGAAWDPQLMKRETSVISDEARGFNFDQIFTLTYWSPVVEPMRDPRWGRSGESFGEDPFLISKIGSGFIQGIMGNDPVYLKAVPCGKHYFANNSEFNRHIGTSDMDDRDMREFYLLPYRNLIEKDKLPAIMTAYNAVNGVPMSANKYLVDTIALRTYGLDGYVTGDCGAVNDMFFGHHYAKTEAEAAALGLKTGVNSDCGSIYQTRALEALKQGLITEADMDLNLVKIFTIRMRLGEFDPRSKVPYAGINPGTINDPSHNDLALEIATKTPVLLKNNNVSGKDRKALPLSAATLKKIAVIGPQADRLELGPYSGSPEQANRVTPLAGIKKYLEKNKISAEVLSSSGGNTDKRNEFLSLIRFTTVTSKGIAKNYDALKFDAAAPGVVVGAHQNQANNLQGIKDGDWTSYNNVDITDIDSLRFNVSMANSTGGTIEVRQGSSTGNLIASAKIVNTQQGGGGGFGRSRIVAVKANSLGITGQQNLTFVFRAPEAASVDKETLSMASSSDVALVFVGTDERTAREESDRFTIELPGNQYEIIKSVAAANPNTIVVIQSLGMVEVEQIKNNPNVAGIIWTGFNGQAQGSAIAKILFGDVNPGGKLNATWYKSLSDLPDISDYTLRGGKGKNGRTYMYFNKDVSYEFGYGLSYTKFDYSNFTISKSEVTPNDIVTITADVRNSGSVDGDEIVQIYVRTPDSQASLERPIKRLRGFQRVTIPAGQTRTVSIDVDCADLWFWDTKNEKIMFDQGKYIFEIAASSKDIKGTVNANMSGTFHPVLKTVVAECGKVVLRPGNTSQTRVTASMSDDSFSDLKNAKVTYKSNNPDVVSVDNNGLVSAKSAGTALITAYVTIDSKMVSANYPLKVMPDLKPASVTVNGKSVPGFNPAQNAYSYQLDNTTSIPTMGAASGSNDVIVNVKQASKVPGTAVITFTDNITQEENCIYINFGTSSASDEFNSPTLNKQWTWMRENKSNWSLSKKSGALTITSANGDILLNGNNAENLLLQDANTDWTIESKITFSKVPSVPAQQGGILAYQDDDNFLKLIYRASSGRGGFGGFGGPAQTAPSGSIELLLEKDGYQKSIGTLNITDMKNNSLVLKLTKKGGIYNAWCSTNGKEFKSVGTAEVLLSDIKAGLITCNGVAPLRLGTRPGNQQQQAPATAPAALEVTYDYFHITSTGIK
jgi:beta-glucosidase